MDARTRTAEETSIEITSSEIITAVVVDGISTRPLRRRPATTTTGGMMVAIRIFGSAVAKTAVFLIDDTIPVVREGPRDEPTIRSGIMAVQRRVT